ncbi:hypothetical protein D0T24_24780 [Duganella sp. BJB480]|uniref:type IV toxin-antitoxin system AbiEi family antitoxin n=1 Tax=unclassified Duganella TaxID=2636909 RepID=UPI000E346B1C|nr:MULTISPECIES: type IV toxin-antitoxin system AbiEi family antitoxin [unclassified Duganella]RFP09212.1 hypothetical protein D0T23_26200 [Duganella sp. BJB475]RFP13287.1 hypothetical protein D0T26_23685 [Duganella sp. BJB489]RFP25438.1 hypothetical protein D0T21_28285 [Duganella sp. BJB476]RFP31644.1 hypothetical protein D0T24_24780 [Duganella sp. BJB480]
MQIYETQLGEAVSQAIEATGLMQVTAREFDVPHYGGHLDCLLQLRTPAGGRRLAIEMKREAYPRDIRDAVWQLESFRKNHPAATDLILMVAALHLSDGAKETLRHHGIAYFDAGGTLFLKHQDWFIDIQRPSKPAARRSTVPLFTAAREQVVHALLHAHDKYLSGLELAELSNTSTYTVSTVLNELERLEWLASEGSGRTLRRKVSRPAELLDAWADAWRQRRDSRSRWFFYNQNPSTALAHVAERLDHSSKVDGIFTGAAAANLVDPHLTRTDIVDLIIPPGQADTYVDVLGLKPVDKGANLNLIERSGASLLFTKPAPVPGAVFASPFILYLDLLDGKGRNKELATQLRQHHLKI